MKVTPAKRSLFKMPNPAGETIRVDAGERMEAGPTTAQSTVGPASPADRDWTAIIVGALPFVMPCAAMVFIAVMVLR